MYRSFFHTVETGIVAIDSMNLHTNVRALYMLSFILEYSKSFHNRYLWGKTTWFMNEHPLCFLRLCHISELPKGLKRRRGQAENVKYLLLSVVRIRDNRVIQPAYYIAM